MLQDKLEIMLARNLITWDTARNNYDALKSVKRKSFTFDGKTIRIEHNPARAVSSLAKTDKSTISARPCFLCHENQPKEQEFISIINDRYKALVNPFPIFPRHFTFAATSHSPQLFSVNRLTDMMNIATELPEYTVFYNGPRAGASAPDHFHFQAGNTDYLPQPEYDVPDFVSHIKFCDSSDNNIIAFYRDTVYYLSSLHNKTEAEPSEEPMMNIFCCCSNGKYNLTIFPRRKHRPNEYFTDNGPKISPGAVDMAGIIIAARPQDYEHITPNDVLSIYTEVSLHL